MLLSRGHPDSGAGKQNPLCHVPLAPLLTKLQWQQAKKNLKGPNPFLRADGANLELRDVLMLHPEKWKNKSSLLLGLLP